MLDVMTILLSNCQTHCWENCVWNGTTKERMLLHLKKKRTLLMLLWPVSRWKISQWETVFFKCGMPIQISLIVWSICVSLIRVCVCLVWNVNTDISCPASSPAGLLTTSTMLCSSNSSPILSSLLYKAPQNAPCTPRPHNSFSTVWSPIADSDLKQYSATFAQQFSAPLQHSTHCGVYNSSQCTAVKWSPNKAAQNILPSYSPCNSMHTQLII